MPQYIARRILYSIPLLLVVSFVSFWLIQLPPGDYMTTMQMTMIAQGGIPRDEAARIADQMRIKYGLDKPFFVQYLKWFGGVVTGDFGFSFYYRKPVFDLIWDRVGLTFRRCARIFETLSRMTCEGMKRLFTWRLFRTIHWAPSIPSALTKSITGQ